MMVKIQTRQAEKSYLKGKGIYNYRREQITILQKYHQKTQPFHNQELNQTVYVQDGSLIIKLTPKQTKQPKKQ